MTDEYKRHAFSTLFRTSDEKAAVERIGESMYRYGFDPSHPIVLVLEHDQWQILDGWHRYLAAKSAGVEPVFDKRHFPNEKDMLSFVERENAARRHMTKAQVVACLWLAGSQKPPKERRTVQEIAVLAGCSTSVVRRVLKLPPEQLKKVADGSPESRETRKQQTRRARTGFLLPATALKKMEQSMNRRKDPDTEGQFIIKSIEIYDHLQSNCDLDEMLKAREGNIKQLVSDIVRSSTACSEHLRT